MTFRCRQLLSLLAIYFVGVLTAVGAPRVTLPELDLPPGLARARDVQNRNERGFFLREGVVGMGISENKAGRPVIRILIARAGITGIPASIEGVEVESQVTGRILAGELAAQATPTSPRERWPRPVPIGTSIAHTDVTAGTLGCQVFKGDACHSDYFVLSNNHVLANEGNALAFDHIVQPGPFDGGVAPADTIAYLQDWEPIIYTTSASNIMDAAIALSSHSHISDATPPDGYGRPRTVVQTAYMNTPVKKYGRTTRQTTGKVTMLNATVHVDYSSGTARFVGQIIVTGDNSQPFSTGGDSGSLVVVNGGTNDRKPIGLLFAGSGNLSVVSPLGPILTRFGVGMVGQ